MRKSYRYETIALVAAIIICMPRILITLMNNGSVYSIIDNITFIFWFIGLWCFYHQGKKRGLMIMIVSYTVFFIWVVYFFKGVSISLFTIFEMICLLWIPIGLFFDSKKGK